MAVQHYLPGSKIGKWTILTRFSKQCKTQAHTYYMCECACGHVSPVAGYHLRNGTSSSCVTCSAIGRNITHGNSRTRAKSTTYVSWLAMKQRCYNPKNASYHSHGGRGIRICDEWFSFITFLRDMGERPPELSLDRIDTNGNYELSNCRWANQITQTNNTRANIRWEYQGQSKTIAEWARYLGIGYQTLRRRVQKYRWSIKKAIETPVKIYQFKGKI